MIIRLSFVIALCALGLRPPVLDFTLLVDTVTVRVGKRMHLSIPYTASPEPTVSWLFNGSAILGHMKASQSMYPFSY